MELTPSLSPGTPQRLRQFPPLDSAPLSDLETLRRINTENSVSGVPIAAVSVSASTADPLHVHLYAKSPGVPVSSPPVAHDLETMQGVTEESVRTALATEAP